MPRANRAGQVAAGVQMRDVELSRVLSEILPEAERNEALVVICQAIREIGKHPQFDLVWRALGQPRRKARSSRCRGGEAMRIVARVSGADRHLMAAPRESDSERPDNPRNAAIGPGVGGIGSDVEDAHAPSPYLVPAGAPHSRSGHTTGAVTEYPLAADTSGDGRRWHAMKETKTKIGMSCSRSARTLSRRRFIAFTDYWRDAFIRTTRADRECRPVSGDNRAAEVLSNP
jgi:hypothetical protein